MASRNPKPAAAHSATAHRRAQPSRGDAQGPVTDRLQQEPRNLILAADKGISAFPETDNLLKWVGTIQGVAGTPYEGLSYKLSLHFPRDYPYQAPTVKFLTACFHPSVDSKGDICLDILEERWSALCDVRSLLLSSQSLLAEPNTHSPLNTRAAQL